LKQDRKYNYKREERLCYDRAEC